jgi:hypothetical protein
MKRWLHIVCLLLLTASSSALADLTFPALFEVVEKEPGLFQLTLTVPLVKGRYMKAKPIVPDAFRPQGDPEATAGTASLTRSWQVKAKPESLHGEAFGLEGLLGTAREVRFLLTTLDGRRHETVLRSTRSIFFVPPSADGGRLAATAAQDGLRRTVRDVGMWSVLACVLFSGMSIRLRTWITAAVTAAFLGCWAMLMVLPRAGLSDAEVRLMTCCQFAGFAAGVAGAVAALGLLRSLIPDEVRRRFCTFAGILAAAWAFYEGVGLVLVHGPAWLGWMQRVSENIAYRWFSPFAADWAMAKLRVPLLSLTALALFVWALVKIQHAYVRITVAGCLLIMTFVLLPYGVARASVPFLSPGAPSSQQARRIIEPMLSEIYHALNLTDEGQTYDQLAEQVSGDLVTDLYLDSRRRLLAGTRQGASVAVKQVEVQDVGTPRTSETQDPAYPCRWTVTAKVTHWQHSHERRNMYEGDLKLAVEDGRWKLAALNLNSEEREVVPGSFSSR